MAPGLTGCHAWLQERAWVLTNLWVTASAWSHMGASGWGCPPPPPPRGQVSCPRSVIKAGCQGDCSRKHLPTMKPRLRWVSPWFVRSRSRKSWVWESPRPSRTLPPCLRATREAGGGIQGPFPIPCSHPLLPPSRPDLLLKNVPGCSGRSSGYLLGFTSCLGPFPVRPCLWAPRVRACACLCPGPLQPAESGPGV